MKPNDRTEKGKGNTKGRRKKAGSDLIKKDRRKNDGNVAWEEETKRKVDD